MAKTPAELGMPRIVPGHFVQFYESDAFLADSVAAFIGGAIAAGDSAAIIATPTHRSAIAEIMASRGIDVSGAAIRERFVTLDAAETLAAFMVEGSPRPDLFGDVIGGLIARLTGGGKQLRCFGEMVALLAAEGNRTGALQLEQLWNQLDKQQGLSLFCAYPISEFHGADDADAFARICAEHSEVIPAESYSSVASERDRFLAVSLLQQKAVMLGCEIERRETVERALAERERELSDFLESANEPMHKVGPAGTILWANKAEFDLLGYEREEYVGRHISDFHVDQGAIADILGRLLAGEDLTACAAQLRCKDGSIRHVVINSTGHFIDGKFVNTRCFTRDVTAVREAEALQLLLLEAERAARAEAERVSRMKDDFLATLSHELRTPLNAIFGWTRIIQRTPEDADCVARGLAVIDRNVRVQTQLIEDLLDMSRVVAGKLTLSFQQSDLIQLIEAAIEAARPAAEAKGIEIRSELNQLAGPVQADAPRLQQVISNLLANSVKFTPHGGKIEVLLARVGSDAEISVSDTGRGIAPDFLPHVFERFRQEDSRIVRHHGGLGIGLSIVKQIVELHHGAVRARSGGEGRGATFVVALPLSAVKQARATRGAAGSGYDHFVDRAMQGLKGVRVLVVDDEADARELVCHVLSAYEADVQSAPSADAALALLGSFSPDVLVSDIGMPGKDGLEFIREVRRLRPDSLGAIPALALTAYASVEDRNAALLAGFHLHISKPIEPQELGVAVASLARRTAN